MKWLEELQMNALPSLQTILYDGWIIRFADGYTNRANSINPIYHSSEDVYQKIKKCEDVFKGRNLRPTYKITPFVYPENLDDLLENSGYKVIHHTSVQILGLSELYEPFIQSVKTDYDIDDEWFEHYCKFNNIGVENRIIYRKMLNNLIPLKFFTCLFFGNEIIACGMAVIENDNIGLFDITVDKMYRNCGYGQQLLINMLKVGKSQGAKNAYLQVMLDNFPALNLYKKLGFKEKYKYYYRVLIDY